MDRLDKGGAPARGESQVLRIRLGLASILPARLYLNGFGEGCMRLRYLSTRKFGLVEAT